MTILDFEAAIEEFRKLRENGTSRDNSIKQLFNDSRFGKFELIKAVEVVEGLTVAESRKTVIKALGD